MGTAVSTVLGDQGESRQDIHLRQGQRGLAYPLRLRGNGDAQLGKQAALNLDDLFLRVQDFDLVFLQFGCGEAFGVDQRLLALVIGRSMMQVGLANLNVVAKDGVELYFEGVDAGPLALALFDLGDVLLAVVAETAQVIKFRVHARLNHSAIGKRERRLRHHGLFDAAAQIVRKT